MGGIDLSCIFFFLAEVLDKSKAHIGTLKDHYSRLADILNECPDQYYRSYYDGILKHLVLLLCH